MRRWPFFHAQGKRCKWITSLKRNVCNLLKICVVEHEDGTALVEHKQHRVRPVSRRAQFSNRYLVRMVNLFLSETLRGETKDVLRVDLRHWLAKNATMTPPPIHPSVIKDGWMRNIQIKSVPRL